MPPDVNNPTSAMVTHLSAPDTKRALERIETAINGLRYGTVAITVHDGRVVQIERSEKIRLGGDNSDPKYPQK
jgi:hypothetical protein